MSTIFVKTIQIDNLAVVVVALCKCTLVSWYISNGAKEKGVLRRTSSAVLLLIAAACLAEEENRQFAVVVC